ncbi:MAG: asparagine synthase (glutamine-hydrolyzing) [Chitinophagaceae bacterium]|nr:asparagine synthase (glutamine-hydrolyzing) [Chitinophagaceae bacterium]
MCGIAGILQSAPRWNLTDLQKMTQALAHRGPDGEGHWQDESGCVLLGHRRLSIIDLTPAGQQPMPYLNRYHIIHNGEIYNYAELKQELQQKGYVFRSATDTEVIAAAYDCWKEDCLKRFDGMFAFAIWDSRENELFAARDRFGEKPFFYSFDEGIFLFASEIKAFRALGLSLKPNLKMLFNFITIGYTSNPEKPDETFFENIHRLPAASFMRFSFVYFLPVVKKYWELLPHHTQQNPDDEEATEQFLHLFRLSVKRRLRSDVEVSVSLSGGIDSSSLTAMVKSVSDSDNIMRCLTVSFPEFEKDETEIAGKVAKRFGFEHLITQPDGRKLAEEWETLCRYQEEPFGSASIYAQFKLYELAAQCGVKVMLDGQGADEGLAGYHKYYKWYWQELFRKYKLSRSGELEAARRLGVKEPFNWKNKIAARIPAFATIVLEKRYLFHMLNHPDLTRDFVRHQSREAYYSPPDYATLNDALYFNLCVYGLEELLRYADRNSMAHGREVRLPFLQHELVEFLFSLPGHFKIRKGWTKWLLRHSMQSLLPEEIVWRKEKVGFEPPQKVWMQDKAVQEAIQEAKKILVKEKILKPEVLNKDIKPLSAHEAANYDWRYWSASFLFVSNKFISD